MAASITPVRMVGVLAMVMSAGVGVAAAERGTPAEAQAMLQKAEGTGSIQYPTLNPTRVGEDVCAVGAYTAP